MGGVSEIKKCYLMAIVQIVGSHEGISKGKRLPYKEIGYLM